jgi:hypothetical protein
MPRFPDQDKISAGMGKAEKNDRDSRSRSMRARISPFSDQYLSSILQPLQFLRRESRGTFLVHHGLHYFMI